MHASLSGIILVDSPAGRGAAKAGWLAPAGAGANAGQSRLDGVWWLVQWDVSARASAVA